MNNKYSGFLTVLLVLIIIAIIGIIGFLGFKYYESYVTKNEAEDFVETFGDESKNNNTSIIPPSTDTNQNTNTDTEIEFGGVEEGNKQETNTNTGTTKRPKFNNFYTSGTIEIPATNLKSPILDQSEYSPKALETAVVETYGPGLNQVGITTISGHNYRNGTFFSNNKKLNVGDRIFITDITGKRLSYTIYEKFEAEENYADYMVKDTQGAIEIALSTCTDDSKARLIILARADV